MTVYVVVTLLMSMSIDTLFSFVPSYMRYPPISLNEIGLPSTFVLGISQFKFTDSDDISVLAGGSVGAGSVGAGSVGAGSVGAGSVGAGSVGTTPGVTGTVDAVPGSSLVPPPQAVMRVLIDKIVRNVRIFIVFGSSYFGDKRTYFLSLNQFTLFT